MERDLINKFDRGLYFYANVATIIASILTMLSIVIALFIFASDKCSQQKDNIQENVNKLISLKSELLINQDLTKTAFKDNEEGLLSGSVEVFFRYYTNIGEKFTEGKILNATLLNMSNTVLDAEIEVNRILDAISTIQRESYQITNISISHALIIQKGLKDYGGTAVGLIKQLKNDRYPLMIKDVETYIQYINSTKKEWYCLAR